MRVFCITFTVGLRRVAISKVTKIPARNMYMVLGSGTLIANAWKSERFPYT